MLLELKVKDLGIIEDIDWKLDAGLNVITGETGAGKSLIIDAVELLLTGSASEDVIRHGASEAKIEGVFAISPNESSVPLKNFLAEKGLNTDDDLLIIGCEIRRQKPGIVRVNGHTITKTILRQIGQLLIDIHGQSEHLSLLDKRYHLELLDAFAHNFELREQFRAMATRLREIEEEIKSLESREKEAARQEEFLQYQINEIKKAALREGEDEELDNERRIIAFSEKLKEYSGQVYQALFEGPSSDYSASALARLNEAAQAMKKLVDLDPSLNGQLEILEKTVYGIEEVARDTHAYSEKLCHDPGRLEEIESRLELIRGLKRKYGNSIAEILAYLDKAEGELEGISTSAERRVQLEKEAADLGAEMGQAAFKLSQSRSQAARVLTEDVKKELADLEMSQMLFEVAVRQNSTPDGIKGPDGVSYAYNNEGIDNVEFLVSTNPGEPLKPLARIASTGEISRFTLALKGALSEADNIPVMIFDEVDIGVGGRSGDIIGKKLWTLSRRHQVICVTHLPQIAVYADTHFFVRKSTDNLRTTSTLVNLASDLRLQELAVMIAGPGYTNTALKNAKELLQKAQSWKKECQPAI